MVNIATPKNFDASASSFAGTSLSINHEATVDLDSTNAFEGVYDHFLDESGNSADWFIAVGPEKLVEVWFSPSADAVRQSAVPAGLKAVSPDIWKDMLDLVNCKVLSIVESDDIDAYLLSESSMFVWPHKLILKTCGTTTLLSGLPRILEIAALYAGFPKSTAPPSRGITVAAAPYRVFYSRKNFLFPERQRGPHRSWRDEVKALDLLFLRGSAYMIGKMNGEHWYLYLTEPYTQLTPPASPNREPVITKLELPPAVNGLEAAKQEAEAETHDETLEILMTDLDEENAKQFYLDHASAVAEERHRNLHENGHDDKDEAFDVFSNTSSDLSDIESNGGHSPPSELSSEGHALGTVVSDACGLSNVYPKSKYPDARVDAYLFTPCGFSANGVVPSPLGKTGTHYFTVHVTPEPNFSYASFETNVPHTQSGRETVDIVKEVVGIFKPGRFTVTLFEAKSAAAVPMDGEDVNEIKKLGTHAAIHRAKMERIPGYRRVDRIVHELDGYDLVFRYYERDDWRGGAPRIGEN
jgi:S-adenosylmethionine decarboxylase